MTTMFKKHSYLEHELHLQAELDSFVDLKEINRFFDQREIMEHQPTTRSRRKMKNNGKNIFSFHS